MERNKLKILFLFLPFLYVLVWLRCSVVFCSYSWLYAAPSLLILFLLMLLTLWYYRLERMLGISDVGWGYLNPLVNFKLGFAVFIFLSCTLSAELLPLMACPFVFIIGVISSSIVFYKAKGRDFIAIKEGLLKGGASNIDAIGYQILSGDVVAEYILVGSLLTNHDLSNISVDVNPVTGLPMVNGSKSVDVRGDPYGVDLNYRDRGN